MLKAHTVTKVSRAEKLRLKIQLAEIEARAKAKKGISNNDSTLFAALEFASNAMSLVPAEEDKIKKAIKKAKKRYPLLEDGTREKRGQWEVEKLEFELQLVRIYTQRLVNIAEERQEHISKIITDADVEKEIFYCKHGYTDKDGVFTPGILYWWKWYAWIVDPRFSDTPLYAIPFVPFPYQEETISWIQELMFERRTSGVIDKSRDMGVTWMILNFFLYYWLFSPRSKQVQFLIGSYNASEVDEIGVPSTMFEKMRFVLGLFPSWMMPKKWKNNVPFMRLVNPDTGSSIIGETANAQFGRSGRFTAILFDEFASFEEANSADTASSFSTNTKLYVSTPQGELNLFAEKVKRGNIPHKSLHWTMHPFHNDKRWYNGKRLEYNEEQIAQELDIDYTASQPGRVYKSYNEVYHIITWSEFAEVFPDARKSDGSYGIPGTFTLGHAQDVGTSPGHDDYNLWLGVAPAGSPYELAGSVFAYREYVAPQNSSVRFIAGKINAFEYNWQEYKRMEERRISHEATSEMLTYQEYGLDYSKWSTDLNAGIAQVRDYLEITKYHLPHPFRKPLIGNDGRPVPIMGRPKFYIIVEDGQGELTYNFDLLRYDVIMATNSAGMKRLRAEFPVYHYPKSETGKSLRKQKPEKKFDDAMDCLRCLAATFFPSVTPESPIDKLEQNLPYHLRGDVIKQENISEWGRSYIARMEYLREHEADLNLKSGIQQSSSLRAQLFNVGYYQKPAKVKRFNKNHFVEECPYYPTTVPLRKRSRCKHCISMAYTHERLLK